LTNLQIVQLMRSRLITSWFAGKLACQIIKCSNRHVLSDQQLHCKHTQDSKFDYSKTEMYAMSSFTTCNDTVCVCV